MLKTLFSTMALLAASAAVQASPLTDYLDKLDAAECRAAATQYVDKLPPAALSLAPADYWLEEWFYKGDAWSAQDVYHCQLAAARISRDKAFASLPTRMVASGDTMSDFGKWYAGQVAAPTRKGEINAAYLYAVTALGALQGRTGDAFLPRAVENARQAAIKAGLNAPDPNDEAGLKTLLAKVARKRMALVETMPAPFTPLNTYYLQGASK